MEVIGNQSKGPCQGLKWCSMVFHSSVNNDSKFNSIPSFTLWFKICWVLSPHSLCQLSIERLKVRRAGDTNSDNNQTFPRSIMFIQRYSKSKSRKCKSVTWDVNWEVCFVGLILTCWCDDNNIRIGWSDGWARIEK